MHQEKEERFLVLLNKAKATLHIMPPLVVSYSFNLNWLCWSLKVQDGPYYHQSAVDVDANEEYLTNVLRMQLQAIQWAKDSQVAAG